MPLDTVSPAARQANARVIQRAFKAARLRGVGRRRGRVQASAINNLKREVRAIKGSMEKKHYGVNSAALAVSSTPQFIQLNAMGQGDTSSTREGLQISMKKQKLRFFVVRAASGAATATQCRFILYLDQQANGAAPTIGDLLQNGSTYVQTDYLHKGDIPRFKILKDFRFMLTDSDPATVFEYYKDWKNMKVFYSGSSSGIGSINRNALGVMLVSNEGVATPTIAYSNRIDFTDN